MSLVIGRISRWASVPFAILLACSPKPAPNALPPVVSIPAENGRVGLADAGVASSFDNDSPVRVDDSDPMWGKRDALVTLVVFSDLQCPFCSRLESTFGKLKDTYGPEKLRIVWKNEPLEFHEHAKAAAEAAMGVFELAGADAFWSFQGSAFRNQADLGPERFDLWAEVAGVHDLEAFRKGRESGRWRVKVEADHALAQRLGVVGTPHTYVNGIGIGGAQPFEKFKSVIDEELRKADLIVAAGGSRSKIYGVLSKANFEIKKEEPEPIAPEDDTSTVWKVPVDKTSIVQGDPNAPVTVILFSDMECPYCRRLEVGGLKKVREEYKEKVRLVWKNEPLPFHSRAKGAANFAMEARAQKGDAAFWKAHDLLMNLSDSDSDARSKLSDEDMAGFAAKLGLDAAKVKAAIKGNKYQKQIGADTALGDAFDVKGTPHMFINGRRLVGAVPFEKFKEIIDQELVKAQALTKGGVVGRALYNELTKEGRVPTAKEPETKVVVAPPSAPFRGGANAKVVIQQFSDFECPFCARVEPTLDNVLKKYGNKVKIVWRNLPLPFHPHAVESAEAAAEAHKQKGSKGFWAMHSLIFKNQRALERSDLDGYAKKIGLDGAKFAAAMDGKVHRASIDADAKAAKEANIQGTPGFLINGYFLSGAHAFEKFEALIDRALLEAK